MQTQGSKERTESEETDLSEDEMYSPKVESESRMSWSALKKRYDNLWRARLKKPEFIKSIRDISISGFSFIALSFVMGVTTMFGVGATFFIGCLVGTMWSSYVHEFDDFGNAHVGFFAGLVMHSPLVIYTTIAEPLLLPLTLLWSSFYILMMSGVNLTYGKLAREAKKSD